MKINATLSAKSVAMAVRRVDSYRRRVEDAADKIARELAHMGYEVAYGIIAPHVFNGDTLGNLDVIEDGPNRYILRTESEAILFFEFGAGVQGAGHPMAGEMGYGPGTYPGQTHAFDPNGWWFPTGDPRLIVKEDFHGQGWGHSYGNPPHMPFFLADQAIRDNILKVAKEVMQS